MQSWGAYGSFAAHYAADRAGAGAGARARRIRGTVLLAACIAVAALLGSLALGSNTTRDAANWPGDSAPASVYAVGPGEPARIPALGNGPAPRNGGADQPLDRQLSGEPSGDDGLMVDVRRVLEQMASEG